MPAVKFTMLFQLATNVTDPLSPARRVGGWSETWYRLGSDVPGTISLARDGTFAHRAILESRALMLPQGALIVGQRFQVVDPRGPSQSLSLQYPGAMGRLADVPQMALLTRVPSVGTANIRQNILRGIPDEQVTEGEYRPQVVFTQAVLEYFDSLNDWRFRGRDLSFPNVKLFTVSSAGAFTTEVPHALAVNDIVRVSRALNVDGEFVGGRFIVATIGPGTNAGTLASWTAGATTGGTIRKDAIIYPQADGANATISRIVTRRVGRPFTQYRGRRQASRR